MCFVRHCTQNKLIIDYPPLYPFKGKIYFVNTVDGRNIYGRQFVNLKSGRYGCFTRTTVPYKPYCTVTVHSPTYFKKIYLYKNATGLIFT